MKKVVFWTIVLTTGFLMKAYAADTTLPEVKSKFCPISHEEVGKDGMAPYKVTYNGKVYDLCCKMCEKDFLKDPAKYSKMMEEQAAAEAAGKKT